MADDPRRDAPGRRGREDGEGRASSSPTKLGVDAPIMRRDARDRCTRACRCAKRSTALLVAPGEGRARLAMLGYVLDEIFVQHRAPSGHPERPARAEAVRDALVAAGIAERGTHVAIRAGHRRRARCACTRRATSRELERVVPGKSGWIDPDTYLLAGHVGCRARGGRLDERARAARDEGRAAAGHRASCARRATTRRAIRRWASACSTTSRSRRRRRARRVRRASRSSTGTSTTATARRTSSGTIRTCSTCPCTSSRTTRAPARRRRSAASARRGATINVGLPAGSARRRVRRGVRSRVPARARAVQAGPAVHLAGFDAFEHDPLAGMRVTHAGLRGDGAPAARGRRQRGPVGASSPCSKAATISTASPAA